MNLLIASERSQDLLTNFREKKITEQEFLISCVLWLLESEPWAEIEVKQYPVPPEEWVNYENLDIKQKSNLDASYFRQPIIAGYLKAKSEVYCHNVGWYDKLTDAIRWLPDTQEYLSQQMKLQEKMLAFKRWVNTNQKSAEKQKYEPMRVSPTPTMDIFNAQIA